jgi:methionyl-tRNA synthetase
MKKDIVSFADFQKIDMRVGVVLKAELVLGSANLLRLIVDMGEDYGEKKIISGISKWYTPDDLIGKKYLFVANLAPKKMMKEESDGMVICADINDHPTLIPVDHDIAVGTVVR